MLVGSSRLGMMSSSPVFCAIPGVTVYAPTNQCAISPDGINWTLQTLPSTQQWCAIAWNGSIFCMIARNSNAVAISSDGVNWVQYTLGFTTHVGGCDITWNGSIFCIVSDTMAISSDGINWTVSTYYHSNPYYSVKWSGSLFLAVASARQYTYSYDGLTWYYYTDPAIYLEFGNLSNGPVFVVTNAYYPTSLYWTNLGLPFSWNFSNPYNLLRTGGGNVVWNGNIYCAMQTMPDGNCATSLDGINWTQRTMPISTYWYSVSWNGLLFCAAARYFNYSAISYDGINWTSTTMPTNTYNYGYGTIACQYLQFGTY